MGTKFLILFFISIFAFNSLIAEDGTGYMGSGSPFRMLLGLITREKMSHFRFYWHDILTGTNPTAIEIVPSVPTYNETTNFGLVRILDNPLTLGPELSSKLVGRAEGLYASASASELSLLMVMNFALTEGKYSGSSITIMGRDVIEDEVREMPVIGGSGVFRFARGYAVASTHSFDHNSMEATVEYNIYVYHY
ncbi:hypothetical protein VNO78_25591 [Psophocarpus tetragonolobus]|uniref:Dirigent protein n=1 Tax=Psophocarpus tetragonolobus TaxID=3891 RepID=A0AAN9S656_PSOTE